MYRRSNAFTLIELLVVISIIALLVAILLPALSSARDAGRVAACLSNERQMMIAASSYVVDAEGKFPYHNARVRSIASDWMGLNTSNPVTAATRRDNWLYRMQPYFVSDAESSTMRCPAAMNDDDNQTAYDPYQNSYSANGVVTHFGTEPFQNQSSLVTFSDTHNVTAGVTIRAASYLTTATEDQLRTGAVWSGWMRFGTPTDTYHDKPHPESSNKAFLDGHAENVSANELSSLYYGLLIQGVDKPEGVGGGYNAADRVGVISFTGR